MKVLHINCNYLTSTVHETEMIHMEKTEIESSVFVPTFFGNEKKVSLPYVNISPCFNRNDRYIFDYKQSKILQEIKHKYQINDFDCIHAYTVFTDGNTARNIKKQYGIPYCVTVRNTDVTTFFEKMVFLRKRGVDILRDAAVVFFMSSAYLRTVIDKYVPQKSKESIERKSIIIPNGIDDFWIENLYNRYDKTIDNKSVRLIYAGKINANKNIQTIQKAAAQLRKKGWSVSLVVVGKIEDQALYNRIIQDEYTIVLPETNKEGLIKLYRENDIFVMPSFRETFGLVYAEAMSQGLPVVYTRGQGFDGQFERGYVGYDVKADDETEIAMAIQKIVNNYTEISANSTLGAKKYGWDGIVNQYQKIYNEIRR